SWSFTPSCTTALGTYTLRVVDDATGRSSNTVDEIVTYTPWCVIPAPPIISGATPISPSQIKVMWTDASSHETGFRIERKIGSTGTYVSLTNVSADSTSYVNSGLTAGVPYC